MANPAVNTTLPWYTGPNGATNFTRHEAQRFARNILESKAYRDKLEARAASGDLPPAVECMLWHYAFGKPVENVNVNVSQNEDLSSLSVDELLDRARRLSERLEEARQLDAAIPAQYKIA